MSRCRPIAPSEQKRFMSPEELATTEGLLGLIVETIQNERPAWRREPAAQSKSLANFVLQIQLFMDEVLGEKSIKEERFAVKIPAAFFRDFAHPNGTLKHIIVWALNFKLQEGSSAGRRFELLSEGLWNAPRIYFWGNAAEYNDLPRLRSIVKEHGGVLATSIDDCSHIVLPIHVINPQDTETYFRPLEQRGGRVFAHWWYHPDSYDCWTASGGTTSCDDNDVIPPEDGRWKVGVEWVELMDKYNEWMNEGDFEIEELPSDLQRCLGNNFVDDKHRHDAAGSRAGLRARRRSVRSAAPMSTTATTPPTSAIAMGSGTQPDALSVTSKSNEIPAKRKRGRPRLSEEGRRSSILTDASPHIMSSTARERKRPRLGAVPIPSGKYVISLSGGVSHRRSFDHLDSCTVSGFSPELDAALVSNPHPYALPVTDIDTDAEETARHFLATRQRPRDRSDSPVPKRRHRGEPRMSEAPTISAPDSPTCTNLRVDTASASHQAKQRDDFNRCYAGSRNSTSHDDNITSAYHHALQRLEEAEAAMRTMFLLWGSGADSFTYAYGISEGHCEPPDVPPVTREATAVTDVPEWLNSSIQHLSDFERQDLESAEEKQEDACSAAASPSLASSRICLPSTAQWFSLNAVHPIEKEQLGDMFFACRKFIDGDAAQLLRVYGFLEFWGLINFQADPQTRPAKRRLKQHSRSSLFDGDDSAVHRNDHAQPSPPPPPPPSGGLRCASCNSRCVYSYFVLRQAISKSSCHLGCPKNGVPVWCHQCYTSRRYPLMLSARHFEKVTLPLVSLETDCYEPCPWSPAELERLVEGLEAYGDNWDSVAHHVGTRSVHECVTRFISLPLGESSMEDRCASVTADRRIPTSPSKGGTPEASSPTASQHDDVLANQIKFLQAVLGTTATVDLIQLVRRALEDQEAPWSKPSSDRMDKNGESWEQKPDGDGSNCLRGENSLDGPGQGVHIELKEQLCDDTLVDAANVASAGCLGIVAEHRNESLDTHDTTTSKPTRRKERAARR